ncbi:MAG: sensor histidine kinase [Sarcina sp.]
MYLIIFGVLIVVFGSTYFLNNFFLEKFYVYNTKQNIDSIYNIAKSEGTNTFQNNILEIENKYNVTILDIPNAQAQLQNVDSFNQNLLVELNKKRVNIMKLWIPQKDIDLIKSGKYVNIIFYQSKLQSNYFAKVFIRDNNVIFIGKSMANDESIIDLANKLNLIVIIISIIISLFLVWLFTRKMVKSINELKNQANNISKLKFSDIKIETGDELEELSTSLNKMSEELAKAHKTLNNKNEDLKLLLSSMSHEIKTPLALIKAYGMGIKDGLDDGTFIDVILNQVDDTTVLIDRLLKLSKEKRATLNIEKVDLSELLIECTKKYEKLMQEENIKLSIEYDKTCFVECDREGIKMVFDNFLSNAIKYNKGDYIKITLKNKRFEIVNKVDFESDLDLEKLWEPFYTLDESRNKKISGTGIGLSIVASILDNHSLEYSVKKQSDEITFYINFK